MIRSVVFRGIGSYTAGGNRIVRIWDTKAAVDGNCIACVIEKFWQVKMTL